MISREALLREIADRIVRVAPDRIARIGVDGVDGAGKTTFADALADVLRAMGRPVIRAGVDGFHNPREIRYRRGRDSPQGFYLDSYDYAALEAALLHPLAPGGSGRYRAAAFDHATDSVVNSSEQRAASTSILLFDGIFLHRPELRGHWDASLFLATHFAVSVGRCAERDGAPPDLEAAVNRRYVEGQRLYLEACDPQALATWVVDNNDLSAPFIVERKS